MALLRSLISGAPGEYTCLVGTMAQEAFATSPAVREACAASISGHAETLEADLSAALAANARGTDISAASLARHTQTVLGRPPRAATHREVSDVQ